jgi:hypothetical protein
VHSGYRAAVELECDDIDATALAVPRERFELP